MFRKEAGCPGIFNGACRLPYWTHSMEFDIETWVPYRCDFKPISTNSLFSDILGDIAALAMMTESELLYMWDDEDCPVGTLVPENLMRQSAGSQEHRGFAIVFAYSERMERILYSMEGSGDTFVAGITNCGIWRSSIFIDECKVLVAASINPLFDPEEFLYSLKTELDRNNSSGRCIPYFAEKFGFRRFAIPYETDKVTDIQISNVLAAFELDEVRRFIGMPMELSLDNFRDEWRGDD